MAKHFSRFLKKQPVCVEILLAAKLNHKHMRMPSNKHEVNQELASSI